MRFIERRVLVTLGLALVAMAVFLPATGGGWIFDDHALIGENPYIRSFAAAPRWFATDFWNVNAEVTHFGERMVYWRPLVTATYAVDWQVGGGSPVWFHVTNLLAHGAVAALAFVALRRWIGAVWPAALAALLFAIHPTKAESVAWVAGRTDVLCMLAILVATTGLARRLAGKRDGIALEIAGTIGAYLCKEQAIVLPIFAAVEAWVAAGRGLIDRAMVVRMLKVALPQAAIAIGYLVVRAVVMPIQGASGGAPMPLGDHALAVLETYGRFFGLTFAPHDLSVQQALVHWRGGALVHSMGYVALGAAGLVALIAAAVVLRRRWPVATVGIGFFLLTLLPTSNVKYSEMRTLVSERFLYLPVLGIALVVGAGLAQLDARWRKRSYALAAACALALGMVTLSRSADFADEKSFWAREQRLHWDSLEARFFALRGVIAERRYHTARQLLGELERVQAAYDRIGWLDVYLAYQAARITARLVPDRDTASLRAIDQFCRDLLVHDKPAARLALPDATLAIPTNGARFPTDVAKFAPQLYAVRADLSGRLGHDDEAIAIANQARASCRTCVSGVVAAALAYARAGRYPEALGVLDEVAGKMQERPLREMRAQLEKARGFSIAAVAATGPAQLQARASELGALELWGRAYDVLAPHKEQIKQAPGVLLGFAELAFRAGDVAVAREMLATRMPATEIDAQLQEWAVSMGWAEPS